MHTPRPWILALCVACALPNALGCECDDFEQEPPPVDRSQRPDPTIPKGERTAQASQAARPGWVIEEDKAGTATRLKDQEGWLAEVYRDAADAQPRGRQTWLCLVTVTEAESSAEGLVPFSDPDVRLKGEMGGRKLDLSGTEDQNPTLIPVSFVALGPGDEVRLEVLERDSSSGDDHIERLHGGLREAPLKLAGERARVECRPVPKERLEALVEELYDRFEREEAQALEAKRDPDAIEEGYPVLQERDMRGALRLIGETAGWQHPYAQEGGQRLKRALRRLEERFPRRGER